MLKLLAEKARDMICSVQMCSMSRDHQSVVIIITSDVHTTPEERTVMISVREIKAACYDTCVSKNIADFTVAKVGYGHKTKPNI